MSAPRHIQAIRRLADTVKIRDTYDSLMERYKATVARYHDAVDELNTAHRDLDETQRALNMAINERNELRDMYADACETLNQSQRTVAKLEAKLEGTRSSSQSYYRQLTEMLAEYREQRITIARLTFRLQELESQPTATALRAEDV